MYTNFAAFISVDYVQKQFPNAKNIEAEYIIYAIKVAQEQYLINTLGSSLYNALTTAIFAYKNSGTAIDSQYTYLRDNYIAPTLLHYTIYTLIPTHYSQFTTIGVQNKSSEYSNSVMDRTALKQLQTGIENTAKFYENRLIEHLINNTNLYSAYDTHEADTDSVPSQRTNEIGGLFLY